MSKITPSKKTFYSGSVVSYKNNLYVVSKEFNNTTYEGQKYRGYILLSFDHSNSSSYVSEMHYERKFNKCQENDNELEEHCGEECDCPVVTVVEEQSTLDQTELVATCVKDYIVSSLFKTFNNFK